MPGPEQRLVDIDAAAFDAWETPIPAGALVARDACLVGLARGRRVLHLGACDAPFHTELAARGALLHQRLRPAAAALAGIDSDAEAVEWLRCRHGIDDITAGDAADPAVTAAGGRFELVLCCDLIEHLGNHGDLLDAAHGRLDTGGRLVVTTANATALKAALRALQGRETVHQQHTCYFSFATLGALLLRHGFRPEGFAVFNYGTRHALAGRLFDAIARRRPGAADGLLMTARRQD
jgi:SAM-dependent methyltransferase